MTTPRPCKFVAPAIGFLLLSVVALAAPIKFEIPAQPAPAALKAFVKQSNQQVVFNPAEMEGVNANEVKGAFEPADALDVLLKGTGFNATKGKGGIFVVKKADALATTGSVRGSLTGEGGKGVGNVLVSIRETGQSTETDRYGIYAFPNVAAGTYVLVASAPGYQTMHIDGVNVKEGRELTLGKEEMRKVPEGVLTLEPFVVHADTVEQLEKFEVTASKQKPFQGANMDISRTINDPQPYYVFDSKTIDQSGATNVEDFLKNRLTMNAAALTNGQTSGPNTLGNTSTINLRGLGADKTLVLVNGRRMAGVSSITTVNGQPDLNGIPTSAIERIEVLPSSASGIYGGSALGGVVNIILKQNYTGGELRALYENTWDTDSPRRTLSANYGLSLEGGKTHLMLSASWSDQEMLLLQDRRQIFQKNVATVLANSPSSFFSSTSPWFGALPNILPSSFTATTLTLLDGTPLNSRNTYIAAGTSPNTSPAALAASLLARAGQWNFDLPATTQLSTGLLRPYGATPQTESFRSSLRRQMSPRVEMFAEFAYYKNATDAVYNPLTTAITVPAGAPTNPFQQSVLVQFPDATRVPFTTNSQSRSGTLGAVVLLPWTWTGELDFTWSDNRFNYRRNGYDSGGFNADIASGVINPFVDTLMYPPVKLEKYYVPTAFGTSSQLQNIALRGSGPLPALPTGTPTLTLGVEQQTAKTPQRSMTQIYPVSVSGNQEVIYFPRKQMGESGYLETEIPLLKQDLLPGFHALDLQVSGRADRFTVDTGTILETISLATPPQPVSYAGPTVNGLPYYSKASYTAGNYTVGLKYQPVPELTLRASRATAFLPPTPDQLITNPVQPTDPTKLVNDSKTGQIGVSVLTLTGGNPGLKPQSSKSLNVGVIWEPTWKPLHGLRLNAEYYKIEQFNFIAALSAQLIVDNEDAFPGRVVRNSSGTITLVDTTSLNLFYRETEGWDLSADYTLKTPVGVFNLHGVESTILHLRNQYSLTQLPTDAVNFPAENGALKYKLNGTLSWEWRQWTVGWTSTYFSAYKQSGAAGGPQATQRAATGTTPAGRLPLTTYTLPQGGDTIPSQTYQDLFVGYSFDQQSSGRPAKNAAGGRRLLAGLSIEVGMRNIFNKVPPFDFFYGSSNYYLSPYGDVRLRTYWTSVRKAF